jgi:hypothetical protein
LERLELEIEINDDLVLQAVASSAEKGDSARATFVDLEFGLELPGTFEEGVEAQDGLNESNKRTEDTSLSIRSNISNSENYALVPGEVLHRHDGFLFDRRNKDRNRATEEQIYEYLYYQPCAVCGRTSSDSRCRCASPGFVDP